MPTVAIIGAGISGIVCARRLTSRFDVRLFDKSRGVSGRMATRRTGHADACFDHGAQYFTVRSKQVKPMLEEWIDDGIVAMWRGNVSVLRPGFKIQREPTPRYVAMPGMNSLGKHLVRFLDVETNTHIEKAIHSGEGWTLTTTDGVNHGPFDVLVSTAPPEQTLGIVGSKSPFTSTLASQQFDPCWATMIHFEQPVPVSYDAAFVHENPLRWICRNNSKPGRDPDQECWVLHASPDWSKEHLEESPEQVTPQLLEAFSKAIEQPLGAISHVASHRWRYSAPVNPLEEGHLWDPKSKLGIAGDWCSGARVEGAILSGLSLAKKIAG
ncbi:protoporphyrinogen oxidase [Bremerella volcania]|uniref:Protoporphyrinogen oxidase n=1 Tax=Bremerella volcania TaxID=2527984 RepID=A0A518CDY2_9BACT|nr:FAD-dependent oxidoreductase [Bremerella volcania]QDU77436.1 protoporphyrinogen oxidase [Bremerella volcania]